MATRILASTILLLLTACASMGSEWEEEALLELRVGETPEEDAIELFGEPLSRQRLTGTQSLLAFRDTDPVGLYQARSKSVTLLFERGRLLRVFQATDVSDALLDALETYVPVQTRLQTSAPAAD